MTLLDINLDLSWLVDIGSSKAPLAFIIFSLIGLYSSIAFVINEEKRMPNRYDFTKLIGYIPFVWGFALLVGISPYVSFFIGLAPEPIFKIARRKAIQFFEEKDTAEEQKEESSTKS